MSWPHSAEQQPPSSVERSLADIQHYINGGRISRLKPEAPSNNGYHQVRLGDIVGQNQDTVWPLPLVPSPEPQPPHHPVDRRDRVALGRHLRVKPMAQLEEVVTPTKREEIDDDGIEPGPSGTYGEKAQARRTGQAKVTGNAVGSPLLFSPNQRFEELDTNTATAPVRGMDRTTAPQNNASALRGRPLPASEPVVSSPTSPRSPRKLSNRRPPPMSPAVLSPKQEEAPAAAVAAVDGQPLLEETIVEDDEPSMMPPSVNLTDESTSAFLQLVFYLRRRYGDEDLAQLPPALLAEHPMRYDLTQLTDVDVDELASFFGKEIKGLARKQRVNKRLPEPSVNITPEERQKKAFEKGLRDMTLKDAIGQLRAGAMLTKFGRKGKASIRWVSVEDRRALHRGEMVAMPHLCWGVDPNTEPSGQLLLFDLKELETGPSPTMAKNREGFVIGVQRETFHDTQCFTLWFEGRTLDLAFRRIEQLRVWQRAFYLVIQKNREMLAVSQSTSFRQ